MLGIPVSAKADSKIDFSCKVTTSAPLPMMTLKLCDDTNDGNLFFQETTDVKGEYVFRYENQPNSTKEADGGPQDMSKMKLVIDLAGAPKDAEVTISDIVLIVK